MTSAEQNSEFSSQKIAKQGSAEFRITKTLRLVCRANKSRSPQDQGYATLLLPGRLTPHT